MTQLASDADVSALPVRPVFHYTAWATLPKIMQSGVLSLTRVGAPHENPLLWFSSHPHWEPTATKLWSGRQMTLAQQIDRAGCVRFLLPSDDPSILDWRAACQFAGLGRDQRRLLEKHGRKMGGNPAQWFAVGIPLPVEALSFQVLLGDAWHFAAAAEMAAVWTEREDGNRAQRAQPQDIGSTSEPA